MNLMYSGKLKMKDGKLIYQKSGQEILYKEFIKNIKEGSVIDVFMEVHEDSGQLSQLARVHAMIREISRDSGMTFNEVKMLVKYNCGYCYEYTVKDKQLLECTSFGDMSKIELSYCIEECYRLGEELGLRLK
jgi:hypothetical protein